MSEHKTISSYLETVAGQIRWKRARPGILSELERHLEDQRDAFAAEGCDNAEQLAVEEMGDPVSVGMELDFIHRPKPQWGLLSLTMLIALAGTFLRIYYVFHQSNYSPYPDVVNAILSFVVGCGVLLIGYFMDYARLARFAWIIYIAALVISVLSQMRSPIILGFARYARYITLFFPVVYTFLLYACRRKGWPGLLLAMAGGVPMAWICLKIPYIFGLLMLLLTGFLLLLTAARSNWFGLGRRRSVLSVAACAAVLTGVFSYLIAASPYCHERLAAAFFSEQYVMGAGYLAVHVRQAIGAAQWIGPGTAGADLSLLSSDNLLTALICRLGWLPFFGIVLGFAALMAWLVHRCLRQRSQLGRLVSLSVTISLSLQALCSVVWNMGFTLLSGAAFPLVTGNLSTAISMGLIGLALSVFRSERIAQDPIRKVSRPRYRIRLSIEKS